MRPLTVRRLTARPQPRGPSPQAIRDREDRTVKDGTHLDCQLADRSRRSERTFVMNHADGWMSGWMGGGMWLWTVIGVLVVVLLVVVINKQSKK